MRPSYEINELAKEESWRMFRIIGEFVDGFDILSQVEPAVTIYGSARIQPGDKLYHTAEVIARGLAQRGFSILTGGGPGLMEAANKGAKEGGANSVGLHIILPTQEHPNPYTTMAISFKYFFVRKVMLVKYASAFILLPGGWGTLDEFFETVTLIQTHKIKPFPVILYGSSHWQGLVDWMTQALAEKGLIAPQDLNLFSVVDQPEQVFQIVESWHRRNAK